MIIKNANRIKIISILLLLNIVLLVAGHNVIYKNGNFTGRVILEEAPNAPKCTDSDQKCGSGCCKSGDGTTCVGEKGVEVCCKASETPDTAGGLFSNIVVGFCKPKCQAPNSEQCQAECCKPGECVFQKSRTQVDTVGQCVSKECAPANQCKNDAFFGAKIVDCCKDNEVCTKIMINKGKTVDLFAFVCVPKSDGCKDPTPDRCVSTNPFPPDKNGFFSSVDPNKNRDGEEYAICCAAGKCRQQPYSDKGNVGQPYCAD